MTQFSAGREAASAVHDHTRSNSRRAQHLLEAAVVRVLGARCDPGRTLCVTLEAPLAPAERLLSLPSQHCQVLWSPSFDDESAGVGTAHVLIGTGASRFVQIKEAARHLFARLDIVSLDGASAPEPSLLGGFAFQPARTPSTVWSAFGDARFVLPRIGYRRRGTRAWLTVSADGRELAGVAARVSLAREATAALRALERPLRPTPDFARFNTHADESDDAWPALVAGIGREIDSGRLEKVVAARQFLIRSPTLPHPALVLERLRIEGSGCTRFALSVGEQTFLGASPERLVRRAGAAVWTEAIAGSVPNDAAAPNGATASGEALLDNVKERAEHDIVVRGLRAALAPLCDTVCETGPHMHALRHVRHLRTGFSGVLKAPLHVLDLVGRLHPTAAVGGAPRGAALAWLDAHEQMDRGLYAGPFGAFDRAGNGLFVVAIRSGLMDARGARLFAGAGIVAGSLVAREFSETRWKLEGLLHALGVA
jgi:isochorismate synthase